MGDAIVMPAPRPLGLPPGERVYAVGDIHGRLDLFLTLMKRLARDPEPPQGGASQVVILGDVVDRGPSSRALVERFMRYTGATDRFVVLKGNHEQMMTRALRGDVAAFRAWLGYGGAATLRSWGVEVEAPSSPSAFELIKAARSAVGEATLAWLEALPTRHQVGEVLFVHAGVRPGEPLETQVDEDLLWIGREFQESPLDHGALVVHGHAIDESGPVVLSNRIAVDTGAYRSGILSAVKLEGEMVEVFRT